MASTNSFSRPPGSISIPVQFVSEPNSTNSNLYNSSFRSNRYETPINRLSNSPPTKKSTTNEHYRSHVQPRQTITTAYDRLINESSFNSPRNDHSFTPTYSKHDYPRPLHKRAYESSSLYSSRSTDDISSTVNSSANSNENRNNNTYYSSKLNNEYPFESDFMFSNNSAHSIRRSLDALNDTSEVHTSYLSKEQSHYRPTYVTRATIHPNNTYTTEYSIPVTIHPSYEYQRTTSDLQDQSESPDSQRDSSPTRPSPSNVHMQESDFKVTKDATNSTIGQNTASFSNDQQVPSSDTSTITNIPQASLRDSNTIALEKLEKINQNLANLNQQIDAYHGSNRDCRIYKGLDEQALKMMISCDELTDVSDDIKEKRKQTVRNVQVLIAKLESKVPINSTVENNSNSMETTCTNDHPSIDHPQEQNQTFNIQNEQSSTELSE